MSIISETPLKGTCCVCGKPINPLMGAIPPLPGLKTGTCSNCGQHACAEHLAQHQKSCQKIDSTGRDWCGTPPTLP